MKIIVIIFILLNAYKITYCDCDKLRFLGDYIDEEELLDENFCSTNECLLDAERLLESATSEESIKPCKNFKEFSVGKFIKFRSIHDHDRSGFLFDALASHRSRQRELLLAPIDENEEKISKVAKNFFQKCIDSNYIRNYGKQETAEYIETIQGIPLVEGADWWPDRVNMTAILNDPSVRLDFFIIHTISRCTNPRDPDSQMFCFKFNYDFDFLHKVLVDNPEKTRIDFLNRLKEVDFMIKVDDEIVNASINHLLLFLEQRVAIEYPGREKIPYILPIKDIGRILTPSSQLDLDWLLIVNRAFLEHSKAFSDDEEILIEDWEMFMKSMELVENTSPRIMMDVFFLAFLYEFEHLYAIYPLNHIDVFERGSKRDFERFEQCLQILETNFSPALLSLYAKKYLNSRNLREAEKFTREAFEDIVNELLIDDSLEMVVKDDIRRKFMKVKIILGVMEEMYDASAMDDMYNDLDLNGDEGILKTTINLINYNSKLKNELRNSFFHQANKLSHLNNIKYFIEEDLLFIPNEYLHYPFYDYNRSRFINTATIFTEIILCVNKGIKEYLINQYKLNYKFNYDSIQLGFKNYQKWEEKNGQFEKKLSGFRLNNQQMYWLAFANTYFMKHHTNVPLVQLEALNLQFKYFHVWFKARPEFQETFNCGDLNNDEEEEFKLLTENFNKVYRIK